MKKHRWLWLLLIGGAVVAAVIYRDEKKTGSVAASATALAPNPLAGIAGGIFGA